MAHTTRVDLWDHIIYNPHHGEQPENPAFGLNRCAVLLAFVGNWLYLIGEMGGLPDCPDDMDAIAGLGRIIAMVEATIRHIEQEVFLANGCTCPCQPADEKEG